MQTSPFKFLPIFLVALALGGALFFARQQQSVKTKLNNLLDKAKPKISLKLPEPTPFIPVKQFPNDALNPSVTPSISPTITPSATPTATPAPKKDQQTESKTVANTKTGTETVCTPVYGMANSCAEHAVVDTGLSTEVFPSLAIATYFGGLFAFVKAKKRA